MAKPKKRKLSWYLMMGAGIAGLSTFLAAGSTAALIWFATGMAVAATIVEAYQFGMLVSFGFFLLTAVAAGPILGHVVIAAFALLPIATVGMVCGALFVAGVWAMHRLYSMLQSPHVWEPTAACPDAVEEPTAKSWDWTSIAIFSGVAAISAISASLTTVFLAAVAPSVLIGMVGVPAALTGFIAFGFYMAAVIVIETAAVIPLAATVAIVAACLMPSMALGALMMLACVGELSSTINVVKSLFGFSRDDEPAPDNSGAMSKLGPKSEPPKEVAPRVTAGDALFTNPPPSTPTSTNTAPSIG